jgi:hypothetical protein
MIQQLNQEVLGRVLGPSWRLIGIEEALSVGFVDLVIVDGDHNYDKRLWRLRSNIKSRIAAPILTNKASGMQREREGCVNVTHLLFFRLATDTAS